MIESCQPLPCLQVYCGLPPAARRFTDKLYVCSGDKAGGGGGGGGGMGGAGRGAVQPSQHRVKLRHSVAAPALTTVLPQSGGSRTVLARARPRPAAADVIAQVAESVMFV